MVRALSNPYGDCRVKPILRRGTPALIASALSLTLLPTLADAGNFQRVATWPVFENLPAGTDKATETAAEILSVTPDGKTLVYTDSEFEALGFVDISVPSAPKPAGITKLDGEPTSTSVAGGFALVGVNTSESFVKPSGHVAVVDLATRQVRNRCDVGGQPDSLALSPDGRFLAVVVENERDEDLNDGVIPQAPAGHLAILNLAADGTPLNCNAARIADLTGLAILAGNDPEPEYVSVNGENEAVVTLQENNHIAIVDLETASVTRHFTAGTVDIAHIDATRDKVLSFSESLEDLAREPDAVAWIDNDRFVTANEGDYTGGSRGATIFDERAWALWDTGNALEHIAASIGHYPEKRAGKKGSEPEGVAVGTYGDDTLIVIGMERANFLTVYRDNGPAVAPSYVQVLPTGVAPEGILPIPQRNLLAVAAEKDSAEDNVRSNISIYVYGDWSPAYPDIVSVAEAGNGNAPIGWGALSGLAANPADPHILYAVPDSFYAESRIFTVDVSNRPAQIVSQRVLKRNGETVDYDLEGIATAADGGFWLVSEGHPGRETSNLLIRTRADGTVIREIKLPDSVAREAKRFGFEGVTATGSGADERVYVAIQREWNDDPKGMVRIGVYTPANGSWGFVHYPLDAPESPAGGWVGLSEIVALSDDEFMVIERDNKGGPDAAIKRLYTFSLEGVTPAPAGQTAPVVSKRLARDLLPTLAGTGGWVLDKLEGLTIASDGRVYAVTDNDGIDDAVGETRLLRLGKSTTVLAQR